MNKCPKCKRSVKKIYSHYLNQKHWRCLSCIEGWEFEAGMWKEVKHE